jgi:hypothetical protein
MRRISGYTKAGAILICLPEFGGFGAGLMNRPRIDYGDSRISSKISRIEGEKVRDAISHHRRHQSGIVHGFAGHTVGDEQLAKLLNHRRRVVEHGQTVNQLANFGIRDGVIHGKSVRGKGAGSHGKKLIDCLRADTKHVGWHRQLA